MQPITCYSPPGSVVTALLTAILLLPATSYAKDFYKWRDENGVTHYSVRPPKGLHSVKIRTTNTGDIVVPVPSQTSSANTQATTESSKRSTAAAVPPQKNPKLCRKAQENLKILQENARVRVQEDDGHRYLSEEEKSDREKHEAMLIDKNC